MEALAKSNCLCGKELLSADQIQLLWTEWTTMLLLQRHSVLLYCIFWIDEVVLCYRTPWGISYCGISLDLLATAVTLIWVIVLVNKCLLTQNGEPCYVLLQIYDYVHKLPHVFTGRALFCACFIDVPLPSELFSIFTELCQLLQTTAVSWFVTAKQSSC